MIDLVSAFVAATLVGGSLITAYVTFVIYRYNRLYKPWLALTISFILIAFRRGFGFASDLGLFSEINNFLKSTEGLLLIAITILQIWGFWSMKTSFETFDIVEKRAKGKVNHFVKRARRKMKR